eukprot:TRINITY_DN4520_c0_g3_i1.p1 TRINITY_DN4520_c0_g3~~TRINITY_DN4520_c0_g3_i1.p1  ORF type:complete len:270 (+),score=42.88 TRINITY_DN4520_c0_g3_i1:737-1546(+)
MSYDWIGFLRLAILENKQFMTKLFYVSLPISVHVGNHELFQSPTLLVSSAIVIGAIFLKSSEAIVLIWTSTVAFTLSLIAAILLRISTERIHIIKAAFLRLGTRAALFFVAIFVFHITLHPKIAVVVSLLAAWVIYPIKDVAADSLGIISQVHILMQSATAAAVILAREAFGSVDGILFDRADASSLLCVAVVILRHVFLTHSSKGKASGFSVRFHPCEVFVVVFGFVLLIDNHLAGFDLSLHHPVLLLNCLSLSGSVLSWIYALVYAR